MREKFKGLKNFNWRLWIALSALALVPAVYQTVKTFLISTSGQLDAFNVIGQMEWFDLINETLLAFLTVPLYSILNVIYKTQRENFAKATFKTGLIVFLLYTLFSIGVLIYGSGLVQAMNPEEIDLHTTATYLRLETLAFMFGIIPTFANVVFVVLGKDKNVYILLAARTVLSLITDFLFVPSFGAYGIGNSNIIVNMLLAAASFLILFFQKHIQFCWFEKSDLSILSAWCKVGWFSGVQQFIDNFIYAVMICKMVNLVAGQGNYWIANNFIWSWLLIPVTALGEVVRSDCKERYENLSRFNYYTLVTAVIVFWAITVPLWTPFFQYAQNLPNAREIFLIVIQLAPFYVAYAGSTVIDNIFIGLGKTVYNAVNSLIVNFVYYGAFYVLHLTNAISFDMNTVILMFGFGMVVHFCVSIVEEHFFLKKSQRRQLT